jgi:hypothetical protein
MADTLPTTTVLRHHPCGQPDAWWILLDHEEDPPRY